MNDHSNHSDENNPLDDMTPEEIEEMMNDPNISEEERERYGLVCNRPHDVESGNPEYSLGDGVYVQALGSAPSKDYRDLNSNIRFYKFRVDNPDISYDDFYQMLTNNSFTQVAMCFYFCVCYLGDVSREVQIYNDENGLWAIMQIAEDASPCYLDEDFITNNDTMIKGDSINFSYPAMISLRQQQYYCKEDGGYTLSILPLDGKRRISDDIPLTIWHHFAQRRIQDMRNTHMADPLFPDAKGSRMIDLGIIDMKFAKQLACVAYGVTWASTISILDDRIATIIQVRSLPEKLHGYGIRRLHKDSAVFTHKPVVSDQPEVPINQLFLDMSTALTNLHSGPDYVYIPSAIKRCGDKFYGNRRYWNFKIEKYHYVDLDFGVAHTPDPNNTVHTTLYRLATGIGMFILNKPIPLALGVSAFSDQLAECTLHAIIAIDITQTDHVDIIDKGMELIKLWKELLLKDFPTQPLLVGYNHGIYYFDLYSMKGSSPRLLWTSKFADRKMTREQLVKHLERKGKMQMLMEGYDVDDL